MIIRPWQNLPTGGHGHVTCMSNLKGIFSQECTPEGCTETHKSSFFPYKQVSGRNGDHEWLRMTNAFILCDFIWKVQKSHAANREGSFNYCCPSWTGLTSIQLFSVDHVHNVYCWLMLYTTWVIALCSMSAYTGTTDNYDQQYNSNIMNSPWSNLNGFLVFLCLLWTEDKWKCQAM